MKKLSWQYWSAKMAWYGGIYWLVLGVLYILWMLFLLTPTVPPLWQQVFGCLLMPFGLLIKIPADSFTGIAVCMGLNTLLWSSLGVILRERSLR